MITLPGNLTSPRAGPILCPGAPIVSPDGKERTIAKSVDGSARVYPAETRAWHSTLTTVWSLDLTADLGPTIALRWLGRHYGVDVGIGCPGWSRFGGTSPVWCLHAAKIDLWFASGGRSAVDRCATNIFDVPGISAIVDPLEALVAACLHAAGVPRE